MNEEQINKAARECLDISLGYHERRTLTRAEQRDDVAVCVVAYFATHTGHPARDMVRVMRAAWGMI